MSKEESTEAMKYVRSLKDPVKRRYANEYLSWVHAGRVGLAPNRGAVSNTDAKTVSSNLDSLS